MKKEVSFIIPQYTTAEQIKKVRKMLGMTQREFAVFAGCSKPTVERWESGDGKITGPIVTLLEVLKREPELAKKMQIPDNKLKMRIRYMFEDSVCTIIDVDEIRRKVEVYNYTDNPQFRAFGVNERPDFEDYEDFIASRCFPKERDKMKLELNRLGIPFYDPVMIIEKTEGRMAEDDFWLKIERNGR